LFTFISQITSTVGQCASNLDALKNIDVPGKKFYNAHKNKIDTVSDVIFDKNDPNNPAAAAAGAAATATGDSQKNDGSLSPAGGKNPSACTTATSSSRTSLKGSEQPNPEQTDEKLEKVSPEDNLMPSS
jgi:hypothetical protein